MMWSFVTMSVTAQGSQLEMVVGELEIVFRNKGLAPPALSAETVLDGSLGLESLDFAELVLRLEQAFGKDPFSNDPLPEVQTLGDLCALY
jgi:acyl carrier protein